ncbi:MAG: fatty acid desaturase [Cyanobacteria bacterium P01_C01_bin.147]
MENTLKKSDFVLRPYIKSDNLRATFQVLNTLIPYILLWILAAKVVKISALLLLPIIGLLVLFSLRCFSLMHDCGHYSLFRSKRANRIVGFILGLVNAIPQHWWSRDHAYHHKTNGDWERYRSIGDFLSTDEFAQLSPTDQKLYGIIRHPLMIFPGGFFYLAFKPRLILLAELLGLMRHTWQTWRQHPRLPLTNILKAYRPTQWKTTGEFWDVLLNNVVVLSGWVILCHWLGARFFLGTYAVVLMLSAAIFICIFFVQHNFEGAYAHQTEGWDYLQGAIAGSSYLAMPEVMKWFTADISYHSIHHLSERIPNYYLRACHERNRHLLQQVTTVRVKDMLACSKLILWDAHSNQLVSIADFYQQPRSQPLPMV